MFWKALWIESENSLNWVGKLHKGLQCVAVGYNALQCVARESVKSDNRSEWRLKLYARLRSLEWNRRTRNASVCCSVLQRVAANCSVLQCVVVRRKRVNEPHCRNALRCVAVCCGALQFVAVCCGVIHCLAVRCKRVSEPDCRSILQCAAVRCSVLQWVAVCCSVLQCVAAYCSVLQCVAVCCSVLQCVAVCCSVLRCVAVRRKSVSKPVYFITSDPWCDTTRKTKSAHEQETNHI